MARKKTDIEELVKKADEGNPEAAANLALMYEVGLLGRPNVKKAKEYHQVAAEAGDKLAQLSLAEITMKGSDGSKPDVKTSQQWARKAEEQNQKKATSLAPPSLSQPQEQREVKNVMVGNKIIIVDESKAQRAALRDQLKDEFQIIEASNGQEGIRALKQNPDTKLIYTELEMSEMAGLPMIEKIRRSTDFKDIPIVVVTADNRSDLIAKVKKAGIHGWITKPFAEDLIAKTANRWVRFKTS